MTKVADGIMSPHCDSASSRFADLLISRSLLNRHNLAVAVAALEGEMHTVQLSLAGTREALQCAS